MSAVGHRPDCDCILCGRPSGIIAPPMADTVRDLLAQERDAARLECDILRAKLTAAEARIAELEGTVRATADPYAAADEAERNAEPFTEAAAATDETTATDKGEPT